MRVWNGIVGTEYEDEIKRDALEWKGNKSKLVIVCPVKSKVPF